MTQADRVHSTPPTNTSATTPKSSRRGFLVQAAGVAAGGAAIGAGLPLPAPPTAAAHTLDAGLIELGAKLEPLVDQYYVARKRWARAMAEAHAERDHQFGPPAERDYRDTPEITAAWNATCARVGLDETSDNLSAAYESMEALMEAINAAPVNSIEGLRAKALVALYEIAPGDCWGTEFSFDDAYSFQQLFTAVAELCGLSGKLAATGYKLPDLSFDNSDDGEDA
jgi:hypothetical protein